MGSSVDDRGDHLVVRTPTNPQFHWGNCLFVTDPEAVDDADRWVRTFGAAVPGADWLAIGLARMPADTDAWARLGLELELDDVLATPTLPRQSPAPPGYDVAPSPVTTGSRWWRARSRTRARRRVRARVARAVRAGPCPRSARPGGARCRDVRRRLRRRPVGRRARCRRVWEDRALPDGRDRVGTPAPRAGVAPPRCRRTVGRRARLRAVGDRHQASNPAGRVYRRAGFELAAPSVQAYRPAGALASVVDEGTDRLRRGADLRDPPARRFGCARRDAARGPSGVGRVQPTAGKRRPRGRSVADRGHGGRHRRVA